MTSSDSTDATLSPTQIQRLHQLMDRGDSFVTSDVEQCRCALVESTEVQSFDSELSSVACVAGRRFSNPRYVGCGAFGVVFFVFDETLGMDVAIKLLRPSRNSSVVQERFLEEAKITANLSHPGIIRLYDSGTIGAIPYITSTLASGGSLADLLVKHPGGLDVRLVCELMIQVADAVAFAHSKATFHRDLKPGNILIETDPEQPTHMRTIVSDFGLAKRWNQSSADAALTMEGDVLGTTRYMSPEQARGDLAAFSIASEVFTLGIILYEMLSDRMPFAGDSNAEIRRQIVEEQPSRIGSVCRNIPKDLEAIVMQCLQKAPEDRYESVASLARDLRRFRNHEPVEAAKPSLWRRTAWQARRHPVVSSVLALSTLTACLLLMGLNYVWWQEAQHAQREYQSKFDYIGLLGELIDDVVMGEKDQNAVLIEALGKFQKSVEKDIELKPDNLKLEHLISVLLNYQAVVFARQHNNSEGIRCRIDSIAVLTKLRAKHNQNSKIRFQYIYGMMDLIVQFASKAAEDQLPYCQRVLGVSDVYAMADNMLKEITQLEQDFPKEIDFLVACHQYKLDIIALHWHKDPERADREIEEVIVSARKLADAHPEKPIYVKPAILANQIRCANYLTINQPQRALPHGIAALECFDAYLRSHLPLPWVRVVLLHLQEYRTEALFANGLYEQAYAATAGCQELFEEGVVDEPRAAFRLAAIQYLAAQKTNRVDELEPLRSHLLAKAQLMPPGQFSAAQLDWAKQLPMDEEVLKILRERADVETVK